MEVLSKNKRGFSLMEVNLSVFLVAAGLLIVFSLYPFGLKESEKAMSDSQEAMFADFVFNKIKGTAMSITNWSDWTEDKLVEELGGGKDNIFRAVSKYDPPRTLQSFPFTFGTDVQRPLKYHLLVETYPAGSSGERKRITLSVKGGKYGSMDEDAKCYVTDVYYCGM